MSMTPVAPADLLNNPGLVRRLAPWCSHLDNLEIAVVVLSQPWVHGAGLQRAELERQVAELASHLPLGQVYFQRINRTCADLEKRSILRSIGSGRSRRYSITPEGFASLVLNLQWLQVDPTVDGSEFELKRELIALWNQVHQHLLEFGDQTECWRNFDSFFDDLVEIQVFGQPVIDEQVVSDAFDVHKLIDLQSHRVQAMRDTAVATLSRLNHQNALFAGVDTAALAALETHTGTSDLIDVARALATSTIPELQFRTRITRYDAYLHYLEQLHSLYWKHFKVVDITKMRVS